MLQHLTNVVSLLLEIRIQYVHLYRCNADEMHRAVLIEKLLQRSNRNLLIFRMGNILCGHRFDDCSFSHNLHALQLAKARILIKHGKADIVVLLQTDEFLSALSKNPEFAVMVAVFQRSAAHIVAGAGRKSTDKILR